ncbi:MAG: hypothetical protein WKG07_30290 [Hymenobacter sp.]
MLSTVGTGLWGLGLLRWAGFRVALLAGAGFGFLQLSLYHATVGRGYWLLIALAAVGFFSALLLTKTPTIAGPAPAGYDRLATLGLLLAGVLGLYTVPTFAYFLASAYGWLGVCALRRADWRALGRAAVLGGLTLLGSALLYAPLLLVSGPALLFAEPLRSQPGAGQFGRALPGYWWATEGQLAGQRLVEGSGHAGSAGGVWGFVAARARGALARRPGLAGGRAGRGGSLVCPAALRRGTGPAGAALERTLLDKAQFTFVLAALGADWALRQARAYQAASRGESGDGGGGIALLACKSFN